MKYEQEDLLEKFIQNEKKSKFWALLSAVAFTLVAVTVVYVAKEVKGSSKNDDGASLRQEVDRLNSDNASLRQQADKLSRDYNECSNNYNTVNQQFETLNTKLKECEGKLNLPGQTGKNNSISILIKYDSGVSVYTVEKLKNLLTQNGMAISFSTEMVHEKFKPEIKYFSPDDSKLAEYILAIINNPSNFANQMKCKTSFISDGSKTAGNFEIWLIYIV
jgi:uncharacterized protein YoxC